LIRSRDIKEGAITYDLLHDDVKDMLWNEIGTGRFAVVKEDTPTNVVGIAAGSLLSPLGWIIRRRMENK
jgi:hypothetical protein